MRRFLPLLALLLVPALHAQAPYGQSKFGYPGTFSIYLTFSDTHLSRVPASPAFSLNGTSFPETTGDFWAPGFGGGVTFLASRTGPLDISFDLRGSSKLGTPGADTVLAGIRVGGNGSAHLRLKPYGQVSLGYLGTRSHTFPTGTSASAPVGTSTKYGLFEVFGGVDYPVAPGLDIRILEIGLGHAFHINYAEGAPGDPGVVTVNSGIVFHF